MSSPFAKFFSLDKSFSFDYSALKTFLRGLRSVKSFVFLLLPASLIIGLFLPNASNAFNSLGLALIQLISFPAIPLVFFSCYYIYLFDFIGIGKL